MDEQNAREGKLPEVALADLPEQTKDYLIRLHVATGMSIGEIVRDLLNRMAGASHPEGRVA